MNIPPRETVPGADEIARVTVRRPSTGQLPGSLAADRAGAILGKLQAEKEQITVSGSRFKQGLANVAAIVAHAALAGHLTEEVHDAFVRLRRSEDPAARARTAEQEMVRFTLPGAARRDQRTQVLAAVGAIRENYSAGPLPEVGVLAKWVHDQGGVSTLRRLRQMPRKRATPRDPVPGDEAQPGQPPSGWNLKVPEALIRVVPPGLFRALLRIDPVAQEVSVLLVADDKVAVVLRRLPAKGRPSLADAPVAEEMRPLERPTPGQPQLFLARGSAMVLERLAQGGAFEIVHFPDATELLELDRKAGELAGR